MSLGSLLRALQAACILLLLAAFFAYLLAPAVNALRRRIVIGGRHRPLSRISAVLLLYILLFVPVGLAWRRIASPIAQWMHVTAPAAITRIFATDNRLGAVDRVVAPMPFPEGIKASAVLATDKVFGYIEEEIRSALGDLVAAARYVRWLAVVPVASFLLLAYAPGFQRSALRVLPHGHLRWRAEEYLRDVNSALAGYVRAQLAAGAVAGVVCAAGFSLLGVPSPLSLGTLAGILELMPVIGPLTIVVMAAGLAERNAFVVIAFLGAFRIVQDYVVYPRLVRRGMHLSSAAVILAVWCGAALNGAAGVVLAIPFAGFLSVSGRHWREYRAIERLVRAEGRATETHPPS